MIIVVFLFWKFKNCFPVNFRHNYVHLGPIGLMSLLAAKASGASEVCITGSYV